MPQTFVFFFCFLSPSVNIDFANSTCSTWTLGFSHRTSQARQQKANRLQDAKWWWVKRLVSSFHSLSFNTCTFLCTCIATNSRLCGYVWVCAFAYLYEILAHVLVLVSKLPGAFSLMSGFLAALEIESLSASPIRVLLGVLAVLSVLSWLLKSFNVMSGHVLLPSIELCCHLFT